MSKNEVKYYVGKHIGLFTGTILGVLKLLKQLAQYYYNSFKKSKGGK